MNSHGQPEIFNSDQGSQFTSAAFTAVLKHEGIAISMDGRGRAPDNIFVERLWRSVKHEDVYLRGYGTVAELILGLAEYFAFYNGERPHQSLGNRTPNAVYADGNGGGANIPGHYGPGGSSLKQSYEGDSSHAETEQPGAAPIKERDTA